jgi:predicted AlkP superfamily phosphohydrolase/phosphomutase
MISIYSDGSRAAFVLATDARLNITPNQRSTIKKVYRRNDSALANLMELFPPHTFLIISDHGVDSYSHLININRWLVEKGWLAWINDQNNSERESKPILKSVLS